MPNRQDPSRLRWLLGLLLGGAVLVGYPGPAPAKGRARAKAQHPQSFLKRTSYVRKGMLDAHAHQRALEYRVRTYGHIPGLGMEGLNSQTAASQAVSTQFFGHSLRVHRKIVTPLQAVEQRIAARCAGPKDAYEARHVGGLRTENTIRGGEVSNHLFGIALDIDPERNPCCHCVEKWQAHPKCRLPSKSPYDRAAVTHCWVDAFEHYGFYWLGLDSLEDTMHFEFLGRPARDSKSAPSED